MTHPEDLARRELRRSAAALLREIWALARRAADRAEAGQAFLGLVQEIQAKADLVVEGYRLLFDAEGEE